MLEVRALAKRFEEVQALQGLDMSVPDGAVYGLVGPNGAGKTTALRHITGVLRPDAGTVTLDGQSVWENPEVKGRMAFIPDEISYYPSSNLEDLCRLYRGIYPRFDIHLFGELRGGFGLDYKAQLRRFSRGMQKQAAFCLAIAARPDLLILDEPVDGLDPVMRRQVWSILLQDVEKRGLTVLVSSHNLRELEDVCDHVGIMHKGRVLLERTLSELQDNVVKVQAVFREGTEAPTDLNVLHRSHSGRLETLIVRGSQEAVNAAMAAVNPIFYELIPLTMEEAFIYELGGADYEVKNILV